MICHCSICMYLFVVVVSLMHRIRHLCPFYHGVFVCLSDLICLLSLVWHLGLVYTSAVSYLLLICCALAAGALSSCKCHRWQSLGALEMFGGFKRCVLYVTHSCTQWRRTDWWLLWFALGVGLPHPRYCWLALVYISFSFVWPVPFTGRVWSRRISYVCL